MTYLLSAIALFAVVFVWARMRRSSHRLGWADCLMTAGLALAALPNTLKRMRSGGIARLTAGPNRTEGDARFDSLASVAADAIITIDGHGIVLSFNQCAEKMFGRPAESMIGQTLHAIIPERYRDLHDAGVARVCNSGETPFNGQTREFYALRKDGSEFPIELTVASWTREDSGLSFVGIIRDITERKRLEAELRRLATTDPLTGILNRRRFTELTTQEMLRARRLHHPLTFIMLDIDWFKRVNDAFGHAVGDKVIQSVAWACASELREIDIVGRLGGEEFGVLLPELGGTRALEVAERLRRTIEGRQVAADDADIVRFTCSLGIAVLEGSDQSFDNLFIRADTALYRAKRDGRNCVRAASDLSFDPGS